MSEVVIAIALWCSNEALQKNCQDRLMTCYLDTPINLRDGSILAKCISKGLTRKKSNHE